MRKMNFKHESVRSGLIKEKFKKLLNINNMNKKLKSAGRELNYGNPERALQILNEIISEDETNYEAYIYRGKAKRELNDFRGALDDYNIAEKLNSNRAEVYNNRSKLFYFMCFYEKALEDINRACELYPDCSLIIFNKGIIESKLLLYSDALDSFSSAIKLDPSFLHAYLKRGLLKEKTGNYQGAINDYSFVIKLNKKCANAYYHRGRLFINYLKDEINGYKDLKIADNLGFCKSEIPNILLNNDSKARILENNRTEKVS
jgi:tetratricopeptide (TPR) repeat protein